MTETLGMDLLAGLDLPLFHARITMRLLADGVLPAHKGGMLRGGLGRTLQRAACPQTCWDRAHDCDSATSCDYRWVFATPHPPNDDNLHDGPVGIQTESLRQQWAVPIALPRRSPFPQNAVPMGCIAHQTYSGSPRGP